jgi:transposase
VFVSATRLRRRRSLWPKATVPKAQKFDRYVEGLCAQFYAKKGRPSIPPGVYFRCLLVGLLEGIDSERGIAWRMADSMSLRSFLGLPLGKHPPDHSTLSRTRRLIDLEVHHQVFSWVLALLAKADLVKGKTVGIDATTLEANAAMRSIVRRDDGQGYQDYLTELAKASGIETPTRQDLAKLDRKRPKKGSNADWVHPGDPEAQITKMKDGSTHLAHKQEHAVDMDTGAILGVTLHGGAKHDTKTIDETLVATDDNLADVREQVDERWPRRSASACRRPSPTGAITATRCSSRSRSRRSGRTSPSPSEGDATGRTNTPSGMPCTATVGA